MCSPFSSTLGSLFGVLGDLHTHHFAFSGSFCLFVFFVAPETMSRPKFKSSKSMRGLHAFISDIRLCQTKETEKNRISKETAKIRKYFALGKVDGYQRKKCVCKLLYIFMLGYEVDFGYMEAVTLLSSEKFGEKQIVYSSHFVIEV